MLRLLFIVLTFIVFLYAQEPFIVNYQSDIVISPNSLILWNLVLLIIYALVLYYIARGYGSFGAMGSIPVRYKPPKGKSLLQSGFIIDEKHDTKDIISAIIELASLGYIKIQEKHGVKYLKKLKKHPETLTVDQEYLLNKILFPTHNFFILDSDKIKIFQKLSTLKEKIEDRLKLGGYLHFDIKRAKRSFIITANVIAIPVYLFSLYTTKQLFPGVFWLILMYSLLFLPLFVILAASSKDKSLGLIAMYFFISLPLFFESSSWLVLLAGPALSMPVIVLLIIYFDKKISRLTGIGLKFYKELQGYKEFIRRTEVPRLKHLLKEHPEYIDQHLAYALMFEMVLHDFQSELTSNTFSISRT